MDRAGKRDKFAVEALFPDTDPDIRLTRVRSIPVNEYAQFFELTTKIGRNGAHQIIGIFNHANPDLLPRVFQEGCSVFSSRSLES